MSCDRMIIDYHTGLSCTGRDAYILTQAFGRSPEGELTVRTRITAPVYQHSL